MLKIVTATKASRKNDGFILLDRCIFISNISDLYILDWFVVQLKRISTLLISRCHCERPISSYDKLANILVILLSRLQEQSFVLTVRDEQDFYDSNIDFCI